MSAQDKLPAKKRNKNKDKEVFEDFQTPAGTTEEMEDEATKVPLPKAQSSEDEVEVARGSRDAKATQVPKELIKEEAVEEVREDPKEEAIAREDDGDDDEEKVAKRRLTSRKSIGKHSPRSVQRTIKSQMKMADKRMAERHEELKKQLIPEAMTFSPGPDQRSSTQLKSFMEEEIERRVKEEIERRSTRKEDVGKGSGLSGKGQKTARKLFTEGQAEEDADEATANFKKRMSQMIDEDEKTRSQVKPKAKPQAKAQMRDADRNMAEAGKKQDDLRKQQKEAWFNDQKKLQDLQRQLQEEKQKSEELQQKFLQAQWEAQYNGEDYEDEPEDGLNQWYQEDEVPREREKSDEKSSTSYIVVEGTTPTKQEDVGVKELFKMMMEHSERTLERVLTATSPTQEDSKEKKKMMKDEEKHWLEDHKIRPVEIEELQRVCEGNSSVRFGDWLHRIGPTISNLSSRAKDYWTEALKLLDERYSKYLMATPLERLAMNFPEEDIEKNEVYAKVRLTITEMILRAIPKELASEAITKRLEDPLKILMFIIVKYQPGGRKEREAILSQITNPEACWTEDKALEALRTWKRRIERAKELKLTIPDPSILLKAVDDMTEKAIKKDARKLFRIESIRQEIKVDVIPTIEAVESLTTFIEAELEESVSVGNQPKVKSINAKDETKGNGKNGGKGKDGAKGKSKDDQKGAKGGKKGKGEPCKYFSLEEGCKFGGQCKGYHRTLKPEEGKCYVCGSVKHQAYECDRPKRDSSKGAKGDGAKKGKPGTKGTKGEGGKGKPVVKQLNTEESEGVSSTRELKAEGSDPREPEREPEKFEKVLDAFHRQL